MLATTDPKSVEPTEKKAKQTKAELTSSDKPAKAGKRSAKALKEVEEKNIKDAKKSLEPSGKMTKTKAKPPRSKLERAGKGYQQAAKKLDRSKTYGLGEAVSLILESSPVKFDATVEIHIRLGVDQKQPDHNIRGSLILPAGSGKNIRVAVFAEGDEAASAKAAGADFTEIDEVVKMIENERINFDVLIAPPAMMPRLSKYAKVLGPKGLMPNPKSGTVTSNIKAAIAEAKAGKIEFRLDSTGIVHLGIGKVSFGADKILQNAREAINAIRSARPASLKGSYITSVHITTTMGPSLTIKTEEL